MANPRQELVKTLADVAPAHVLVADDDPGTRGVLRETLEDAGYTVDEASSGEEVIAKAAQSADRVPDLILLDHRFPGADGIQILQRLQEESADIPVVLVTGTRAASTVIKAMQLGAKEYITKPLDLDGVVRVVQRVLRSARADQVAEATVPKLDPSERIIGSTPAMITIFKTIGRVARTPVTVLISGDTGTGKELVAEALHTASDRRLGPLVKVNCPALPETLLESELFGHEKGAFTGALNQHRGRFEAANKGTIFLDEISEMTLGTQSKLLRVLQEREFERVGGTSPVKVDVRVVAATNRNLWEEVVAGRFREDLYFRLNVIHIHMPPLRERRDDIPALVSHFLNKHRYSSTSMPARISQEAMEIFTDYEWPGNVRQLEHIIERAVVLCRGELILPEHILFKEETDRHIVDIEQKLSARVPLDTVLREVQHKMADAALRANRGDNAKAAEQLAISLDALSTYLAMRD